MARGPKNHLSLVSRGAYRDDVLIGVRATSLDQDGFPNYPGLGLVFGRLRVGIR